MNPDGLETLWEDSEHVLWRQRGSLILAPASPQPSPLTVAHLERTFALRDQLDEAWALRPRDLVRRDGRPNLVFDDPGGDILARHTGAPWQLEAFLRVAIGLASAVRHLHDRNLIHKDIKPSNLVVEMGSGTVRLSGFGRAARSATEPPSTEIAGTLEYMSPEQTGRLNRPVDARSDLYSVGVTLYELLTGKLPFTATTPIEWIHSHLARPAPALEHHVPAQVAAIVAKLLAKTADDRYQTAAGLEHDLQRCVADLRASGRIELRALGTHDHAHRLLIAERLYGRSEASKQLLAAYERASIGATELVLVSGYSGIGKTALVDGLLRNVPPARVRFGRGKFDQYKRDIPYATLADALQGLVREILQESDSNVARWRAALQEAIGGNGALITSIVPELELLVGPQTPVPEVSLEDAKHRFHLLVQRVLSVFARPEHPLILFLDDLQWVDRATLEILRYLLSTGARHMLIIGAYRDNEVVAAHPLLRTLAEIRKSGTIVPSIVLGPLPVAEVASFIADALSDTPARVAPLAQLVHDKTGGNPFFVIQFLFALRDDGLLGFDDTSATWHWDLSRIVARGFTDNLAEFMVAKISRLAVPTREVLKQLACVGRSAPAAFLAALIGHTEVTLEARLWDALRAGLIVTGNGEYAFPHDRVQEASYALTVEAERTQIHLRIAKLLVSFEPSRFDEQMFEIANHYNKATAAVTTFEERRKVAELDLAASRRAATAIAFDSAARYVIAGLDVLGGDAWTLAPELAFALTLQRANCEYLTGELTASAARLADLAKRPTGLPDQCQVACLRAAVHLTMNQGDEAIGICLDQLRAFGIDWHPRPADELVRAEYEVLKARIPAQGPEQLVDLPLMTHGGWRACMDVLLALEPAAVFIDKGLHDLGVIRMANLSIEHGNCDASPLGFSELSLVLWSRFGDRSLGFRFGELGRLLVEQRELLRFAGRVFTVVGHHVLPWRAPVVTALALIRRANTISTDAGDLVFRQYTMVHIPSLALAAGAALDDIQREIDVYLGLARRSGFELIVQCLVGLLGLVEALRGVSPKTVIDETPFLDAKGGLAIAACWFWIRRAQTKVFEGDFAGAVRAIERADPLMWTTPSFFERAEFVFYAALAYAGVGDLEAAARHHATLVEWTADGPETFTSRAALVGAELARLEGRVVDAELGYEAALDATRTHGLVHEEGLAHEIAARFYESRGLRTSAQAFRSNARACYERWGAYGKVRQLDRHHRGLSTGPSLAGPLRQLDVSTVLEISHAVSSEIVLERLIERLMAIAVEHAGAARGLLITPARDGHRIEAEALAENNRVSVRIQHTPVDATALPESVLHYVVRTLQIVNLDDASKPNAFSADAYLSRTGSRSVLCFPLVRHGELAAVLYLENALTSYAFTADRIAVLRVLASQAAISLENARLYHEMRRTEIYLAEGQKLSHTGSFGWPVGGGRIVLSDEARQIFGFDMATVPTTDDVMALVEPEQRAAVRSHFGHMSPGHEDWRGEYRITVGGARRVIRIVGHAVDSERGAREYIGSVMDITAAKRSEEELRRAHLYLDRAQALSHVGSFGWNIDTGEVFWSQEAFAIYGYDLATVPTAEHVIRRVHPDDRARIVSQVEDVMNHSTDWISEFRLVMPDGTVKYAHVTAGAARNEKGEREYIGAVMDVTDRRRAEQAEALALANDRLERALRGSNVGIWDFSVGGESIDGAAMYSVNLWESLGYDHDATESGVHAERWFAGDREQFVQAAGAVLRNELRELDVESRMFDRSGTLRWRLNRGVAERDPHGAPLRLIGTSVDITDRKVLEAQLRSAKEGAEAASQAKNDFLANVSHEIRTPMNAVIGMTELLLESEVTPDQQRWLRSVKSAADSLLVIIDDLLDFSKIEAGKLDLYESRFGLRAELDDAMRPMKLRAERSGLRFWYHVDEAIPDELVGDVGRLRQVLINLVGNAVKFTSAGEVEIGVRTVRIAREEVELAFEVRDTGIGIPADKQALIFQAFTQQDTSTTRLYGGTGLGLTIAARLAALMSGRISVASEPGRGSTFTFTVRFARPQSQFAAPTPVGQEVRGPSRSLRVLVAEDNDFNSQLLRELLSRRGHELYIAKDGLETLRLLEQGSYDLLLLDLHMPGLDGFEVISRIRRREVATGAHLPVIALTARSRREDRERCLAAGMDDFLAKPIHAAALWAALERITAPPAPLTLVDVEALLAACDDDAAILERLRTSLTVALPLEMAAAAKHLAAGDLRSLQDAAHRLHGMISAASSVAGGLASALEDEAAADHLDAARGLTDHLHALVQQLLAELNGATIDRLHQARRRQLDQ